MHNETTKRYSRTMNEAFGPYATTLHDPTYTRRINRGLLAVGAIVTFDIAMLVAMFFF